MGTGDAIVLDVDEFRLKGGKVIEHEGSSVERDNLGPKWVDEAAEEGGAGEILWQA